MMTHSLCLYRQALSALLMTSLLCACVDQAGPSQPMMKLSFATLDSSCQKTVNGSNAIPTDITRLVAVLTRPDGQKSTHRAERSAVEASGTWHIKGITEGGPLSLEVFGCDANGSVKYAGQSQGIDVVSQQKSSVRAFLAPIGTLACTGDASLADGTAGKSRGLPKPTSLASSVALSSGDVLITGGLGSWLTTEQRGTATRQSAIYEHHVGHFRAGPNLSSPRVWHHTLALTATRALIVGGVTQLNAIGDNSLNAPVMMPKVLKQSWASPSAEVLDVEVQSNGLPKASIPSKADVGAGGNLWSAALRLGDGIWFVGGLTQNGQASKEATYLQGLAALAEGEAGARSDIQLQFNRIRPGLVPLADGSVLVWGGNVEAKIDQAGEWISKSKDSSKVIVVEGDEALLKDPLIITAAPSVTILQQNANFTTFMVVGGMPFGSPLSSAQAPSYLVRFDTTTGKATLKTMTVAGKSLYGGLATASLKMAEGGLIVAGGLVSLSASEPCAADQPECLLRDVFVLPSDIDLSAVTVNFTPIHTTSFSTGQLGVTVAPLPKGALLAGGQSSVVQSKDTEPLTATARVVMRVPVDEATICGP